MEQAVQAHLAEYGTQPDVAASAPGRINLLGEHSWYFKDKTLAMAVDMTVVVLVSLRGDDALHFYFPQHKERKRTSLGALRFRKEDRWANAFKAVLSSFVSAGIACAGMDVTVYSETPPSCGFGITAAIKVASAGALRKLFAPSMGDEDLALCIDRGSKSFLGENSCMSDVYTAMHAKAGSCVLTDYNDLSWSCVPFDFRDKVVLLTDARVPRASVWNEETLWTAEYACLLGDLKTTRNGITCYEDSDAEINEALSCVREDYRRRLLCIMKEQQQLNDAVAALKGGNFSAFAKAVVRSHELLRDLFSVSCPEIDWLVKRVVEGDLLAGRPLSACSRITGRGFGRITYTILAESEEGSYRKKLAEYERIFGFRAACYKVQSANGMANS